MNVIKTKYANKMVENRYYSTVNFSGDTSNPPKELTEEEFKQGKQGIVWMDNKTGKLIFRNGK